LCLSCKKYDIMEKQKAECGLSVQYKIRVHGNEKSDIKDLLTEICFPSECPMRQYGDNKATIYNAEIDVFHERTKHIEIDCHKVRKKL